MRFLHLADLHFGKSIYGTNLIDTGDQRYWTEQFLDLAGRLKPDAFETAFRTLDRLALGMTAPAHGLELTQVRYPDAAFTDPASLRWHDPD